MKKVVVFLFLSLLVGMVNASTMPVVSNTSIAVSESANATQNSTHGHCEEVVTKLPQPDSQSIAKVSLGHYCCASIAVLHDPVIFPLNQSSDFYFLSEVPTSTFNIPESIFKPPKQKL